MRDEHPDRGASRRRPRRSSARVGVLLGVLIGLVLFLTLHGPLQGGSGPVSANVCSGQTGAPEVRQVYPSEQSSLREVVSGVVPQRVARLYEEGAVLARSAWTDEEPSPPPAVPSKTRPGGYEMRWWAPNGDDVVADVFVFGDAGRARRFFAMAASTRCRRKATRGVPAIPAQAINLSWLNPDGAAQADVFIRRGLRVYRVADAPAGQHGGDVRPGSLTRAFLTVDALACLLPGARCAGAGGNALPA